MKKEKTCNTDLPNSVEIGAFAFPATTEANNQTAAGWEVWGPWNFWPNQTNNGGLVLALFPRLPEVRLKPDIVFLAFLPPLMYWDTLNSSCPSDLGIVKYEDILLE